MNVLEKLQARASGVGQFYGSTDEELDREAIAEIERLRAALADAATCSNDECHGAHVAIEALRPYG